MLLRLRRDATPQALESALSLARELGYRPRFVDAGHTVLELEAEPEAAPRPRFADRSRFEDLAVVAGVLDHTDAPERVQRGAARADTLVRVGDAAFGGKQAGLIAGPCSVEDPARLLEIARAVAAAGATLLRGGAFKPRTSPYAFQGLGLDALPLLAEARAASGLGIVTEVLDPRDVEPVAAVADVLQIGSRSMTNTPLIQEAARSGKPLLIKRGLASKARELLLAAEAALAQGNANVVLCERGVRGFDTVTRNVLDVGAIAWLKRETHLPVIADPSHAAGSASLVPALAKSALAAGADGLIIEVHPAPHEVHSDGAQAITPETFARIARDAEALLALDGRTLARPSKTAATPSATRQVTLHPPKS